MRKVASRKARTTAPAKREHPEDRLTRVLKELEAEGLLRLAKRPLGKFRAVRTRGKRASQIIIEYRRR